MLRGSKTYETGNAQTAALLVSASVAACLLFSGCTQSSPPQGTAVLAPSLKELAAQWAHDDTLSDWDRAVVEKAIQTGTVSQADYDEGADNFEACLKQNGLHWVRTRLLNGVVEFQPPQGAREEDDSIDLAAVQDACYVSTWQTTQELFRMQQANPGLLTDVSIAAVDCLKDTGIVGEDFTTDDFDKLTGPGDPSAEWPFDVEDPRAQTCLYSLGYAISVESK